MKKIGWLFFCIKYKLGLAREGIDFITLGQKEQEYDQERQHHH